MPRLHLIRFLVVLSAVLVWSFPGYSVTRSSSAAEVLLLAQANQDRAARGLAPVQPDPLLTQAALYHAQQMVEHNDISHGFAGEPDLSERGSSAGVHFSLITENVAEAQSAEVIHDLWMHSPDHRANLLDPEVNAVGIAVIDHNGAAFAVEDFAATVTPLSLDEQERTVLNSLSTTGLTALNSADQITAARSTCGMQAGYAGAQQPWYILRYRAAHLDHLPSKLQARIGSGMYHRIAVGACSTTTNGQFASYTVAVLLYP